MSELDRKFKSIYDANSRDLYAYIVRSIREENTAQDLLQDTFLNFINMFRDKPLPEDTSCRMYLFRISRNLIINHVRTAYSRRVEVTDTIERELDRSQNPELTVLDQISREEASRLLQGLLDTLPEDQKTAMILRYFHDMRLEEIAEVLDTSVSTAYRLLKRGSQKMGQKAEKDGIVIPWDDESEGYGGS